MHQVKLSYLNNMATCSSRCGIRVAARFVIVNLHTFHYCQLTTLKIDLNENALDCHLCIDTFQSSLNLKLWESRSTVVGTTAVIRFFYSLSPSQPQGADFANLHQFHEITQKNCWLSANNELIMCC